MPPDDAPVLKNLVLTPISPTLWRIEFLSNVVLSSTDFGKFRITIQKRNKALNIYEDLLMNNVPEIPRLNAGDIPSAETLYRSSAKDASGFYEFEYYATAEAEAWYQISVTDPLGRRTSSLVYYKKPVVSLRNIVVNMLAQSVELSFEINVNNKIPPYGHYKMEIYALKAPVLLQPKPAPVLLYSANIDAIGVAIPLTNPAVYMNSHGSQDGFFTYYAVFKGAAAVTAFSNATVIIYITDPNGKKTEFTNARRALTK